jgi:hypothetical protein
MAAFFEIKAVLDAQQIEAVPFKGFWLAQEMYGNLADRETRDIDLYIHLHDLDAVIALMAQSGYRAETSDSPRFIERVKKESAEYNFARYEDDSSINHFEFHWKIGSALLGMDISLNDLASQIVPGTLQDHDISVFTPSANLLLAIMHHGGKDPMIQLKHILDIGMILKKQGDLDWPWIMRMARRFDIEKLVYLGLRLASDLTGVKIPDRAEADVKLETEVKSSAINKLAEERKRLMSLPPDQWHTARFNYRNLLFHLRSRTGLRLRAGMIRQSCWSSVVGFLVSEKLLRIYKKKRYQIDREAV